MRIKYRYNDKIIYLKPYNTAQEKELLLISGYIDSYDEDALDTALDICNIEQNIIDSMTIDEKKALLYRLREISVGDDLQQKFKCPYCRCADDIVISCSNIIHFPTKKSPYIKDPKKFNATLSECLNQKIDDLDWDIYEDLEKNYKDYITTFDFIKPVYCNHCHKKSNINIGNIDYIINCMSEGKIDSLYFAYNNLVYFGHYSKLDIDSLYPFERTILTGLLKQTQKDLKNGRKQ